MYLYIKRLMDLTFSLCTLIIIGPCLILIALIVFFDLGRPILFRQEREGRYNKVFSIMKFRTMTDDKDADGALLPNKLRLSTLGSFLRSTSLDELPELFNILIGDMSIIGPRPLPPSYNPYYTDKERKRFEVRGGLIPPDSVYEDPVISWDKQLRCEASYAENVSFKQDVCIFLSVFKTLNKRKKQEYGTIQRQALSEERKRNEQT